jgi:hypothetical protein
MGGLNMTWWNRLVEFGPRKAFQSRSDLPYYKELERNRDGKDCRDFSGLENSPEMDRLRAEFESELLSLPLRPAEDEPLLTSFLVGPSAVFTITLPDSTPCLVTFSTCLRAGEYARIHAGPLQLRPLTSSPNEFVQMLGDLTRSGTLERVALDVCPHCRTFAVVDIKSMMTPADILKIWAIHKSGELARESLYFAHAQGAVGRGNLKEAKETVLEAIQHVTMDSARLHLLLGKIALSLKEKGVLREAKNFLEFLGANQSLRELLATEESGEIEY